MSRVWQTFKLSLGTVLLLAVLIFVLQNRAVTHIQFLVWQLMLPRALIVLGVLLIGVILGSLGRRHRK